ncbi:hypothetical protein SAMN05216483_1211 [Streptomyces sp. 2131.1]|uniref:hypothetical protein n=1 Tax=Streptomyces sp. 2131.1 TaxID=1855346 RepID=UPI000899D5C8|nr:hypothetical protein SAMN05216483_1211 [Streptomyces sp. 2131.1]
MSSVGWLRTTRDRGRPAHGRRQGQRQGPRQTADIKATAPVFHTQGQNLSKALTTLDGLGKPWGDDEQGKQFGDA